MTNNNNLKGKRKRKIGRTPNQKNILSRPISRYHQSINCYVYEKLLTSKNGIQHGRTLYLLALSLKLINGALEWV